MVRIWQRITYIATSQGEGWKPEVEDVVRVPMIAVEDRTRGLEDASPRTHQATPERVTWRCPGANVHLPRSQVIERPEHEAEWPTERVVFSGTCLVGEHIGLQDRHRPPEYDHVVSDRPDTRGQELTSETHCVHHVAYDRGEQLSARYPESRFWRQLRELSSPHCVSFPVKSGRSLEWLLAIAWPPPRHQVRARSPYPPFWFRSSFGTILFAFLEQRFLTRPRAPPLWNKALAVIPLHTVAQGDRNAACC